MNPTDRPVASLFDAVIGQERAVDFLRLSAAHPVHAYLFVGPDSAGARNAALGFAASVLCPNGGCGECSTCRRALHATHPDVALIERAGASILVGDAREVTRLAMRSPMEGTRKVLILTDFHAVEEAAPALLKTIEEPPPSTVFCVLADQTTPDLVTIASRCVQVDFPPLSADVIVAALVREGVDEADAAEAASLARGSVERARAIANDHDMRLRMKVWRSVPELLDGTAGKVIELANALAASLEEAAAPVIERHKREDAEAAELAKAGLPQPSRRDTEVRQRREQRRARTDDLRAGLATLANAYRDRLSEADTRGGRRALAALDAIADVADRMQYNPGEVVLIEGILAKLS